MSLRGEKTPLWSRNHSVPEADPHFTGSEKPPRSMNLDTDTAIPPPRYATIPSRTHFACLSLHMTDRIRLLNFPSEDTNAISAIVQRNWAKGIQHTRPYGPSLEFKLSGRPWQPGQTLTVGGDRLASRRLVKALLQGMFDIGWMLKAGVDVSSKETDKDSLLFRLQQPPPPSCTWLAVSFDSGDKMHLIDAPIGLCYDLVERLGSYLQRHMPVGGYGRGSYSSHAPSSSSSSARPLSFSNTMSNEKGTGTGMSKSEVCQLYEFKFQGYPWHANGEATMRTRLILLALLGVLEEHGFSLYGSVDQDCVVSDSLSNTDSWYCNRDLAWTPGKPVLQ